MGTLHSNGTLLKVHVPDNDARAMVLVGQGSPSFGSCLSVVSICLFFCERVCSVLFLKHEVWCGSTCLYMVLCLKSMFVVLEDFRS